MKKKNRRNSTKYPGLKPELNLKTRYDLLDQEYADTLPDKKVKHCSNPNGECKVCSNPATRYVNPKEWLNKFNEEFVNTKFDHDGTRILDESLNPTPVKTEIIENAGINHDITTIITKKNTYKKQAFDSNNSRNRDILTQQKASGRLVDYEKIKEGDISVRSPEDQMIIKEEIALRKKKR